MTKQHNMKTTDYNYKKTKIRINCFLKYPVSTITVSLYSGNVPAWQMSYYKMVKTLHNKNSL